MSTEKVTLNGTCLFLKTEVSTLRVTHVKDKNEKRELFFPVEMCTELLTCLSCQLPEILPSFKCF